MLMIGEGAEEISEMILFFPENPFPRQGLSKFLFYWSVPLKIYILLEKGLQNFVSRFPPAPSPDH